MPVEVAFHDASVLYPAPLRDLLLELAVSDLYRARWSARVHDEWTRALLRSRPDLTAARLERTRRLMDSHVHDVLVTGFEDLVPSLELPDPSDRHVLAAAIRAEADIIVTANLKDFPASSAWRVSVSNVNTRPALIARTRIISYSVAVSVTTRPFTVARRRS